MTFEVTLTGAKGPPPGGHSLNGGVRIKYIQNITNYRIFKTTSQGRLQFGTVFI
jgi:hypothetical protein